MRRRKSCAACGSRLPIVEPGKEDGDVVRLARRLRQLEALQVIGADRQNLQRRHEAPQRLRGFDQPLLRNVDRHIRDRVLELLQEHARLESRAGAEPDDLRVRADRCRHFRARVASGSRVSIRVT